MELQSYGGYKTHDGAGGQTVYRWTDLNNLIELKIQPSQKIRNHSTEFNWGYGGSGPAQLALAILLDVTGDPQVSQEFYQWFKEDIVSRWGQRWAITATEVLTWLVLEQKRHEEYLKEKGD